MNLRQGSTGPDVEQLQIKLKALRYYDGDVDGDFGPRTATAVLAFQRAYEELVDDAIAGPLTRARIDQALVLKSPDKARGSAKIVPCDAPTWAAFEKFVRTIVGRPVKYGPGRGLFVGGKFVVTHGPGALNSRAWNGGQTFPSFHCTSFTNFFLSWLFRRNQDYTHAGNIPSLFVLCTRSAAEHVEPQNGWTLRYRGFGEVMAVVVPDGSGAQRTGLPKVLDARELLDRARAGALPTFVVFAQSTKINGEWKWWHHTGLFAVRDNKLFRIAADGSYANGRWSGHAMQYVEITDANVGTLSACAYRCYGADTINGAYGDQRRPIADVDFED